MLPNPSDNFADDKREAPEQVRRYLSRREILRAAAAGAAALAVPALLPGLLAPPAEAADLPKPVQTGTFYFPRLLFHVKDETGDQWNILPVGDVILRKRLADLTNINVKQDPLVVRLADLDGMCRYPFVFATSEGYFDLPHDEMQNLKEFLLRGGFVFADDCVYRSQDRFFRDYIKMINKLFPDNQMREVPKDHEIYDCYFKFPEGPPKIREVPNIAYGLFEPGTGRIMTYATSGDLHCGWCCMFFAKDRNEAALRMGVNVIIYYLTH